MARDKPIRLIALDLDGTLLNAEKTISPRNREALTRAAEAGVTIALASGRMTACIAPTAERLGIDCFIIAYNGGMARGRVADGRPILFHNPLEARYSDRLIDFCRGKYLLNVYFEDKVYAQEAADLREWADLYSRRTGAVFRFVPDLEPFKGKGTTKAITVSAPEVRNRLHDEWFPRLGDETTIVKTDPEYLEFMERGTDKGVALEGLCRALGIPVEQAMACGDGDNDAEMLAAAGLGVAMANARAATRAAADEVSPLTNLEDAVADAVERHVLS